LLEQAIDLLMRAQRQHFVSLRMATNYIQRILAD